MNKELKDLAQELEKRAETLKNLLLSARDCSASTIEGYDGMKHITFMKKNTLLGLSFHKTGSSTLLLIPTNAAEQLAITVDEKAETVSYETRNPETCESKEISKEEADRLYKAYLDKLHEEARER